MEEEIRQAKMIMLTNKSGRKFTTSQGEFYPGTSKEFPEAEAAKLLGYSKEILRIEDAMKNPEVKDRVGKLEAKIVDLESLVKAKDGAIKKLREDADRHVDGNEDLKAKDNRIAELEDDIKEVDEFKQKIEAENKELQKVVESHFERITELEKLLQDKFKKGSKK